MNDMTISGAPMKINFVTTATDKVASYRYHNQIPARELEKRGHETIISPQPVPGMDIYIFSKHWNAEDSDFLNEVAAKGAKTVFHCCDHHFNDKYQNHYEMMIADADKIIASTSEMASVIKQYTGRDAIVIPDSYEWDEKEPRYTANSGPLRVLWFGHPSNLRGLMDVLSDLKGCKLKVCTKPGAHPDWLDVVPYSKDALLKCFRWCDVVIIPSRMSEKDLVKSHNRLIEAVRNGKFVIASPLPAYQEYPGLMFVGNIKDGIEAFKLMDGHSINKAVKIAQQYIRDNYSPEKIGELWEKALS